MPGFFSRSRATEEARLADVQTPAPVACLGGLGVKTWGIVDDAHTLLDTHIARGAVGFTLIVTLRMDRGPSRVPGLDTAGTGPPLLVP